MTDDEYRAQLSEIENGANAALTLARRRFALRYVARRSSRYAHGLADALIEIAIAGVRERIEARMREQLDELETKFYAEETP